MARMRMTLGDKVELKKAMNQVCKRDEALHRVIERVGEPSGLMEKRSSSSFESLLRSIVSQQLATSAAKKIYARVSALATPLSPASYLALPVEKLREAGLSQRKAEYVLELSRAFGEDGPLDEESIIEMDDIELYDKLTAIKGIGPWTVDMFKVFHLKRPNVLPVGDLGIKKGFQKVYSLKTLPSPKQMEEIAEKWTPYRTLGSYYMWRSLEGDAQIKSTEQERRVKKRKT